jgi:hypothetical protein
MSSTGEGAVTRWLGDLKSGGDAAAPHLWERYFDRLVHLARRKLQDLAVSRTRPCLDGFPPGQDVRTEVHRAARAEEAKGQETAPAT